LVCSEGALTMEEIDEDEGWEKFDAVVAESVARLRAAKGDDAKIVEAIRYFVDEGTSDIHSPSVLWDYFSVSSPSMPAQAGYDETQESRATEIFEAVMNERFGEP
jgi:hypothetical protein